MKNIEGVGFSENVDSVSEMIGRKAMDALQRLFPVANVDAVASSFQGDVLSSYGIEASFIFHRLSEEKQREELISIAEEKGLLSYAELEQLTNPSAEFPIAIVEDILDRMFANIPEELVAHYREQLEGAPQKDILDES